jgi:hypothetical protein
MLEKGCFAMTRAVTTALRWTVAHSGTGTRQFAFTNEEITWEP